MAILSNGKVEVEIPDGTKLVEAEEALERIGVSIVCEVGGYACCRVRVVSGIENLEPDHPKNSLAGYLENVGDGFVLPCCAVITSGRVEIDPDERYRHLKALP